MEIKLHHQSFLLLPEKAAFWPQQEALILSDLHIGKSMHFRKEGIPIPGGTSLSDLQVLAQLVQQYQARQVIIVGDMFHSRHNTEVDLFAQWKTGFPQLTVHLAKGNHDLFKADDYLRMGIIPHHTLQIGPFLFSHTCIAGADNFCFSGHIHPGIKIQGPAKQSIKLPCFHITKNSCTLPAFSLFTGLSIIHPAPGECAYIISAGEVLSVKY